MVTFTKNWELALFFGKSRSIRNTNLFALRIEQKFKDCTIQSAACKENKTLLAFNEALKLLVEQLLYLYLLLGFILFMNRKIINQIYFFCWWNIRIVLFFVVDSTLAITSWHTITTSYYSTLPTRTSLFLVYKKYGSTTSLYSTYFP
jgi:hypothetical protein